MNVKGRHYIKALQAALLQRELASDAISTPEF
jgi:hypothetical protein